MQVGHAGTSEIALFILVWYGYVNRQKYDDLLETTYNNNFINMYTTEESFINP